MTDATVSGGDVERYEQLRARALDGEPSGFRLGLALLERRGVVAWSRAWGRTAPARARAAPSRTLASGPFAADDDLVRALASLALARVAGG